MLKDRLLLMEWNLIMLRSRLVGMNYLKLVTIHRRTQKKMNSTKIIFIKREELEWFP